MTPLEDIQSSSGLLVGELGFKFETQHVPYLAHIDPSGVGYAHSSKAVEATRVGWGNMRNVTRCKT
jgi:hypothetical protein